MKFYVEDTKNNKEEMIEAINAYELKRRLYAEGRSENVKISLDADSFLKDILPDELIMVEDMQYLEYENEHVQIKVVNEELVLMFKNIMQGSPLTKNLPINISTYMQYIKIKQFIYYVFGEPNVNHSK